MKADRVWLDEAAGGSAALVVEHAGVRTPRLVIVEDEDEGDSGEGFARMRELIENGAVLIATGSPVPTAESLKRALGPDVVSMDCAELLYGPDLARHRNPQAWARCDAWRLGRPVTRDRRVHVPDPARPSRRALDASFPPCVPTDGAAWAP